MTTADTDRDYLVAAHGGGALATREQLGAWLAAQDTQPTPWYVFDALPELYAAAADYRLDPIVLALMCWHETRAGQFGGHVTPAMHNPCGLRVEPDLLDQIGKAARATDRTSVRDALMRASHASFGTLEVGCEAFAQHVVAYLGPDHGIPDQPIVDPRYGIIARWNLTIGPHATVRELADAWASSGYGDTLHRRCGEVAGMLT